MDVVQLVHEVQGIEQLRCNLLDLVLLQLSFGIHEVGKFAAFDPFWDDVVIVGVVKQLKNGHDVGMRDGC